MFQFSFLLSAILFILLDSLYLHLISNWFQRQITNVQGTPIKLSASKGVSAALCYVFLIAGLNYFIIKPNKSVSDAFLFGLIIYGVYETTNYTLFDKWSVFTVIIDTLWGGILFALTTYLVRLIRQIF
jgi:uncharacterized membrane protein